MTLKYQDGRVFEDAEIEYERDVCDSYFSFAWNVKEDRKATDSELDELTSSFPDIIHENHFEHMISAAEDSYDAARGH